MERQRGRQRVKLKGLGSSFPFNSLISSSHGGLGYSHNVYTTSKPVANAGMAHIMLNLPTYLAKSLAHKHSLQGFNGYT